MKSSVEKISSLERKLNIEVPAEMVRASFEKMYQSVQKEVALKGFRKGKAPLNMIRKYFSDRVKQDVAKDIIQEHYASALDEHKLQPVAYPTIDFEEISEDDKFAFTAEFEVRPEVKLTKVEGLKVQKEIFKDDEEGLKRTLEDLRKSKATLEDVSGRAAASGDTAKIDFEGRLATGPLENGSAQDFDLELGSNTFIPGFEEAVMGMAIGSVKDVEIKFPEDYHVAELKGQPVTFKVTLQSLKQKSLPELNDEFAKTVGNYENLQALRDSLSKDIRERETKRIDDDMKDRLIRALVEANPVDLPKTVVEDQKKLLVEDTKKQMRSQGMSEADFADYTAKWDTDFDKTARFMIHASYLMDKVAADHNLRATGDDVETKLVEYAKQTGIEIARIKEFYGDEDRRMRLVFQVTEEKVKAFLLAKADVKDVSREEILKLDK